MFQTKFPGRPLENSVLSVIATAPNKFAVNPRYWKAVLCQRNRIMKFKPTDLIRSVMPSRADGSSSTIEIIDLFTTGLPLYDE